MNWPSCCGGTDAASTARRMCGDRRRAAHAARAEEIASEPSRRLAHLLEVCILGDEQRYDTAARMNLTHEIVRAYEILFYNVRSRLNDWSFIKHAAVYSDLSQGPLVDHRRRVAMKLIAYGAGIAAVDGIYGGGSLTERWVNPLELVGREAAQAALDSLADLYGGTPLSPQQIHALADGIKQQLARSTCPTIPVRESSAS